MPTPKSTLVLAAVVSLAACSSKDLGASSVTTSTIADKSVTNAKLADQAVDGRTLASGAAGSGALAAGAVGTGALQDHAVSAAKLASDAAVLSINNMTGAVSISGSGNLGLTQSGNSLTLGLTGPLDAATVGGLAPSAFSKRVPNVVTVAASGGDFTTITDALNSIQDASATHRYVVRIAPGVYSEQVQLKPFVSLVGAGIAATTITHVGTADPTTGATIVGSNNADVSNLTIENTGGEIALGLYATGVTLSARDVAIRSTGGTTNAAVVTTNAVLTLKASSIDAEGGTYAYGLDSSSSTVRCDGCEITVSGASTANYGLYAASGLMYVGASLIRGTVFVGTGSTVHCPASYDENYVAKTGC